MEVVENKLAIGQAVNVDDLLARVADLSTSQPPIYWRKYGKSYQIRPIR